MIDILYRCDFCSDLVDEQEYINQKIFRQRPVKEINLCNYLVCKRCAAKIHYTLLKFKEDICGGFIY